MDNQTLVVISDKHLDLINEQSSGIYNIIGYRTIDKAITELPSIDSETIAGILIILSADFDSNSLGLLRSIAYIGRYLDKKIVIYTASKELRAKIDVIANEWSEEEDNIELCSPAEQFTADFIRSLLTSFLGEVYIKPNEDPEKAMKNIISRVKDTSSEADEDDEFKALKRLVGNLHTDLNVRLEIDNLKAKAPGVIKDDSMVQEIDSRISDLSKRLSEMDKKSDLYKKLKNRFDLLDTLKSNRSMLIQTSLISTALDDLESEFKERIQTIENEDMNLKDIESRELSIDELKIEKAKIEREVNKIIQDSTVKINQAFSILNLTEYQDKLLLVQNIKNDKELAPLLNEVNSSTKTIQAEYNVVSKKARNLTIEWKKSTEMIRNGFAKYVNTSNQIEEKYESLVTELKNTRNIKLFLGTNLATKSYAISTNTIGMGASTLAWGITSNYKNPLIVDLRYVTGHLDDFVPSSQCFNMEDWENSTMDDIIKDLRDNNLRAIIPNGISAYIEDTVEFTKRILGAIEQISDKYDIVVFILNTDDIKITNLILDYVAICLIPTTCNINHLRLYTRRVIETVNKFEGVKIKYLIFTPEYSGIDYKTDAQRIGCNILNYRFKGIPNIPVDLYKSKGKNIFDIKPVLRERFKI